MADMERDFVDGTEDLYCLQTTRLGEKTFMPGETIPARKLEGVHDNELFRLSRTAKPVSALEEGEDAIAKPFGSERAGAYGLHSTEDEAETMFPDMPQDGQSYEQVGVINAVDRVTGEVVASGKHYSERALLEAHPDLGRNLDLAGVKMTESYLPGRDFTNASFRNGILRGSDLEDANLSKCDLRGADLRNCKLSGAKLAGALVDEYTQLEGADVDGADLRNFELKANLEGVKGYHRALID